MLTHCYLTDWKFSVIQFWGGGGGGGGGSRGSRGPAGAAGCEVGGAKAAV